MWNPSTTKAVAYRKVFCIGLLLTLYQIFVLLFDTASRALGADTVHSVGDLATIGGTAYLLWRTWASKEIFLKKRRAWLLFGVWSLALGGLFVGGESLSHLFDKEIAGSMRSLPLLFAALGSAGGNWLMHHVVHGATRGDRDALDRNNLDHMFWDGVLSLAVFVAYLAGTPLIDRLIAVVVGLFVLPYLAWKRWKEDSEGHAHHHDEHPL